MVYVCFRHLFFLLLLLLMGCQPKDPHVVDFKLDNFNTQTYQGQVLYVFFGFTHCPQVCPKTFVTLKEYLKQTPDAHALFISVDPKRDTPEHMKSYFENYPKNFSYIAPTDEAKLREVMKAFKANYKIYPGDEPIIDHTTHIFVLNKKHQLVDQLPYDIKLDELTAHAKTLFRKSPLFSPHRQVTPVNLIAENKVCDLSLTPCEVGPYKVELGPKPVTTQKDLTLTVTYLDEKAPQLALSDFEGVEINMGYLRPQLEKHGKNLTSRIQLPLCESPEMNWKVTLFEKDNQNNIYQLYFKTMASNEAKESL